MHPTPINNIALNTMKKIALLISDNLLPNVEGGRPDRFELVEEVGKLKPALAAQGMELSKVRWREIADRAGEFDAILPCLLYTSPSPRDRQKSRMPSSA